MKDNLKQHSAFDDLDDDDEQPEQEEDVTEDIGFDDRHRDDTYKDFPENKRDKLKDAALKRYKNELLCPGFDIGRGTVSRKNLRMVCKEVVMESSINTKRDINKSGSSSVISAGLPVIMRESQNAFLNALRKLQHERLVVARLGFAEKAFELDKVISVMRNKIREERKKEEKQLLQDKMKQLKKIHLEKRKHLEDEINEETEKMENRFNEEGKELLLRQERDFINLIKGTTRRAIGRVKKCNCEKAYLCRHNKTASYNTRKPSKEVVQYRRNAARLKQGGRPEEALMWQDKASQLDQTEQEEWRKRVATSIVTAPWGANEAVVDQMADSHRKELQALRETHRLKRTMTIKNHEIRKRNFENLLQAELRKTKIQCLKQAAQHATLALSKRGKHMGRPKMTLEGDEDDGLFTPSGGSQLGSPGNDKEWSGNNSQMDNNNEDEEEDDNDNNSSSANNNNTSSIVNNNNSNSYSSSGANNQKAVLGLQSVTNAFGALGLTSSTNSSNNNQNSSFQPTNQNSYFQPTNQNSFQPTNQNSFQPTNQNSFQPTNQNSFQPTNQNSFQPTNQNSFQPTNQTSFQPTNQTSFQPTNQNSFQPTNQPSNFVAKPPATPAPSTPTYRTTTSILKSHKSDDDEDSDDDDDDDDEDDDSGSRKQKQRTTQSSRPVSAPPVSNNANYPVMQIPAFMTTPASGGGLSGGLSQSPPFGVGGGLGLSPVPPAGGGMGRLPSFMRGFQSG